MSKISIKSLQNKAMVAVLIHSIICEPSHWECTFGSKKLFFWGKLFNCRHRGNNSVWLRNPHHTAPWTISTHTAPTRGPVVSQPWNLALIFHLCGNNVFYLRKWPHWATRGQSSKKIGKCWNFWYFWNMFGVKHRFRTMWSKGALIYSVHVM